MIKNLFTSEGYNVEQLDR